jgi:hypothetical protein
MAKAYYIPNGPKNLAPIFEAVNFKNVASYYVSVKDSEGDIVATSNINNLNGCCDDDKIRIHFLNRLGAIDAINFKLGTEEHETKSDTLSKSIAYPLDKTAHAESRSNVKSNNTLTGITVDYTEAEKEWLEELFDSPLAWQEWSGIEGQEDSYIPIYIIDKRFEKVKLEDRFMYQVEIEFRMSHEKFIIRN